MAWSQPYHEILISFRDRYLSANGKEAKGKVLREVEKAIRSEAKAKHRDPPNDLQQASFPVKDFVQVNVIMTFTESLQLVSQLQEVLWLQKGHEARSRRKCCDRRLGASWLP